MIARYSVGAILELKIGAPCLLVRITMCALIADPTEHFVYDLKIIGKGGYLCALDEEAIVHAASDSK